MPRKGSWGKVNPALNKQDVLLLIGIKARIFVRLQVDFASHIF